MTDYRSGANYADTTINGVPYKKIERKIDQSTYIVASGVLYAVSNATHIQNNSSYPIKISLIPFDVDFVKGFTLYPAETKTIVGDVYVQMESNIEIKARLEIG
jgi:hypothetical protein